MGGPLMPNRIVREAILSSERIAALGWPEEVFYRRLMSIVDDYGRTEANAQLLRARCYPLQTDQVRAADIARWMAACQKAGVILCYEVGGKQYLEVLNFGQQQRSASKCPPPPAVDSNCQQPQESAHLGVSVSVSVSEDEKTPRKRVAPPCPEGVTEQTWNDWLHLRKTKKAAVTDTVLAGAREQAALAGMSLEAFLRIWCTRGSQGLMADWLKPAERPAQPAGRHTDAAEATARMLAEQNRGTKPPPAQIRAQIADVLKGKVLQ
jgi:hypothetical protein